MPAPILIAIEDINVTVSGVSITDFPVTGTYLMVEKMSVRSTSIEGLNRAFVTVRANGSGYRVTLTVLQGSDSDVQLFAAMNVSHNTRSVLAFAYTVKKTVYTSANCSIVSDPSREVAGDGSPNSVYVLEGSFPIAIVGGFGVPPVVTAAQIAAAIPV